MSVPAPQPDEGAPSALLAGERPTQVAVVIPAKNEAERIEKTILAARQLPLVDLVVVVDDGSTDATSAIAMGVDALVVRHRTNRGKAAAMATGAQVVAIRDSAERAGGDEDVDAVNTTEERVPGHTGPLPVIDPEGAAPRALLFIDADMGESATAAQPLIDAVVVDGVDMAIAVLPPQPGAGGRGTVVNTARSGIRRATGWEPQQPLSGTRCITRETWDACQPLARGWGVETALTIDALDGGFWVKEIPCDLQHRATGDDLKGRLHRAAQLRDVVFALMRRRHVTPADEAPAGQAASGQAPAGQAPIDDAPADDTPAEVSPTRKPPADAEADAWELPANTVRIDDLPVVGEFTAEERELLQDVDHGALATRMNEAPVAGEFRPEHAVILAAHLDVEVPELASGDELTPEEYVSLVVHAAVEAHNQD